MADQAKTCPECGELSRDPQWCDTCGTRLGAQEAPAWLEVGSTATVLSATETPWVVRITDTVDAFSSRRVLFGTVTEGPEQHLGQRLLVEERESHEADLETRIPDEVRGLFRTAIAVGRNGPHSLRAYEDTGALTLEDMLELSGNLSYQQVKDCFRALLDTVVAAHDAKHLVLAIAPWTVRLDNVTVPMPDGDVTRLTEDNPTRETPRDVRDTLPAVDITRDENTTDEEIDAIEEPVEEFGALAGKTLPGYRPLNGDEPILEEMAFHEPRTGLDEPSDGVYVRPPEHEHNIDDLWGDLDDADFGESGFGDTGVLPSQPLADVRAYFEGIDELFAFDAEPTEVPVIMGFSPPELLGRVRADLGPHCDVFALGMVLYYMVAGRIPPASVYTRYAPAVPARNYRPGFPPGLQPIISRATRPNPQDRFATVVAMRDEFLAACEQMERRALAVTGSSIPRAVIAVDTHVGIAKGRRNPTNQDAVFGKVSDDGRFALVVVADGVSTASYGSGDLASAQLRLAAVAVWDEILPRYLLDERLEEVEIISSLLARANTGIVDHVNQHFLPFEGNPHEVMGTTALVAVIRDGIVTLASLGDSRVYIQTQRGLEQVTADHNLWTLSVLEGVSADAALSMPHGDALARCLGTFQIEDRTLVAVRPEADYFRFAMAKGDTMLMTTDGLIDFAGANPFVAEENILAVMLAERDPALACLELILLANRGGGGDNIGVGIVHFV